MIFEIPDIGAIEFEVEDVPSLADAHFYTKSIEECMSYNFLTKSVNGHTIYLCNYENGAGLEHYLSDFIFDLSCINDIKYTYVGDVIDYYSWLVDECGDSDCEDLEYFQVMIDAFKKEKRIYLINITDDTKIYLLVDFPLYENHALPHAVVQYVEEKSKDIYLRRIAEYYNYAIDEDEDFRNYSNFSCASDWGKKLQQSYIDNLECN